MAEAPQNQTAPKRMPDTAPAAQATKGFRDPETRLNMQGASLVAFPIVIALAAFALVLNFHSSGDDGLTVEAAGTWVSSIAVIAAASFAVFQILQSRSEARATAFFEIMKQYQDQLMVHARELVLAEPKQEPRDEKPREIVALSTAEIGANEHLGDACLQICRFYEIVGTLVRFKSLEFRLVNSYLGTRCIRSYRRLRAYIHGRRVEQSDPDAWRYFEYLALRCVASEQRRKIDSDCAYYRSIQPGESVDGWFAETSKEVDFET